VHATLIAYPRYHDPVTGLPCPVEIAVERLADGDAPAARRTPPDPRNAAGVALASRSGFQKTMILAG
jgi:capsular polysaccharide export protein